MHLARVANVPRFKAEVAGDVRAKCPETASTQIEVVGNGTSLGMSIKLLGLLAFNRMGSKITAPMLLDFSTISARIERTS